jgi:hypothetical protein
MITWEAIKRRLVCFIIVVRIYLLGLSHFKFDLQMCANAILFKFVYVNSADGVMSECATEPTSFDTFQCTVYYWQKDLDECPEIVYARFGHEAVHAIRWFAARKNGI